MQDRPKRLHRTRKLSNFTPAGAVYVGRPTLWSNVFSRPGRIGHKRSVILFNAWIEDNLTPYIIARGGFGEHEIIALRRRRDQLLSSIGMLRGRDLQCWCPLTSDWCHAEILLRVAN